MRCIVNYRIKEEIYALKEGDQNSSLSLSLSLSRKIRIPDMVIG
jgi:hypothetical protein